MKTQVETNFEDWFYNTPEDGFRFRFERFREFLSLLDSSPLAQATYLENWIEGSYKAGYEQAKKDLAIANTKGNTSGIQPSSLVQ